MTWLLDAPPEFGVMYRFFERFDWILGLRRCCLEAHFLTIVIVRVKSITIGRFGKWLKI
jgi:hypothetical protein